MATYQEQLAKLTAEREAREKAEAERKASLLTPDQVSHWRLVLANMGIPFAMSMPEHMVQRFKDGIQAKLTAEYGHGDAAHSQTKENT